MDAGRPRQSELVKISLWVCSTCGYGNWATRNRCNACTRRRLGSAKVVEEWWHRARVPPEVVSTRASIHSEAGKEPLQRRIPGLPSSPGTQPTGRKPIRFVEGEAGKESKGSGKGKAGLPVQEGAAMERERGAGGGGEEKPDRAEEISWKDVAAGGKKRVKKSDQKATGMVEERNGGNEDEGNARGDEKKTAEEGMPPERVFLLPDVPRAALAKRLERQEERETALRERGAKERQLLRAAQKKQETAEKLKAAGGRTPQSLGLQIKKEEENK